MEKTMDLTRGEVPLVLLRFFFPMLAGNALQQAYTFVDSVLVGKGIGDEALGAVGNLSGMMLLVSGFLMGITNGFGVNIAQYFGAGDKAALRRAIAHACWLCGLITACLTVGSLLLLKPMLQWIHTDTALMKNSLLYGYILFGCLLVTTAYNLCACILRSQGDSRTPLMAVMVSSAVNLLLDVLLIFVFHAGVAGAAAATVAAQGVSVWVCLYRLRKHKQLRLQRKDFSMDMAMNRQLLNNGLPAACMNSITAVGCMAVQGYVNALGAVYTSAYSASCKLLNLLMLPGMTAGFAMSAFVSQNKGAGYEGRIRQGLRTGLGLAVGSWLVLGSVVCLFPKWVAGWLLNGSESVQLAGDCLRVWSFFLLVLNLLLVFRHTVQGLGHPLPPMISGFAEMLLRLFSVLLLLPGLGFRAVAHAEWLAWLGALIINWVAYVVLMHRHIGLDRECKRE
ncbi:MAG: MATE family efflux transporter [Clostridia bacterium]|nr:MATE family efflux transporter [Clostridia bacterium]